MKTKVAINGFGRIGRQFLKAALAKKAKFEIVAINDLTTPENLAYLLKYDTAYGRFAGTVKFGKNFITVNGKNYPIYAQKDPSLLPWKKLGVDVVVESTGIFIDKKGAELHLKAGAKKVVISAPAKGEDIQTYLISVNDMKLGKDKIVSNASCTTNCIAPVISMMNNKFGVKKAVMTTCHAATATQKVVDGPDVKDFRRGRSILNNVIPSTTGAAIATTLTIPSLKGKFDGISLRVPTITGSVSDITMVLKKKVTVEQVNAFFRQMDNHPLYKGIVKSNDDEIVSSDVMGTTYSAIVDLTMTKVVDGDLVKVLAWYDNEWGYSHRLVEMVERVAKK